jgi:antitoxin HicB
MKKDLSYYLSLDYPILILKYEENGKSFYEAEFPDLPGCGAHGITKNEALKRLEDAKELWITARLKRNLPIPEPVSIDDFSGRYLLRISPRLHMQLTQKAKKEGLSLNQYLRKTLEESITLEDVLERVKMIEREIKYIRTRIEGSEVAYAVAWKGEELQSEWWQQLGKATIAFGASVAEDDDNIVVID